MSAVDADDLRDVLATALAQLPPGNPPEVAASVIRQHRATLKAAIGLLDRGGVLVAPGELLGPKEAAALIGVDRTTVSRWHRAGYTPPPLQELSAFGGVPIWTLATLERFAAEHHGRSDASGRRPAGLTQ